MLDNWLLFIYFHFSYGSIIFLMFAPLVCLCSMYDADYPDKNVQKDAQVLSQYLWSRRPALEPEEAKMRYYEVREKIKIKGNESVILGLRSRMY